MARTGRPKAELLLTAEERETLVRWSRRAKSSQALALRCRIVLACAEGVAEQAGRCRSWACIRRRSASGGAGLFARRLDGLVDEDRPGRPPSITRGSGGGGGGGDAGGDAAERHALVADIDGRQVGLSKSTIGRIWRNFGLKPHLADTFKLSTDPLFVEKVVDVVGLYHNPPERAVVLCVDEKSQIQALDRSQPVLPMMPGMPERRTHDYDRNGITSLFAAFNIADGDRHRRAAPPAPRRRVQEVPDHDRQDRARRRWTST